MVDILFQNLITIYFQTPLFNWNVKQLFLYLTAEYTTTHNEVNYIGLKRSRLVKNIRTSPDFRLLVLINKLTFVKLRNVIHELSLT